LLPFDDAQLPHATPVALSLVPLGVAVFAPPAQKYPAFTLEQLLTPPVLYLPAAHGVWEQELLA
jgi:hypothetical protein